MVGYGLVALAILALVACEKDKVDKNNPNGMTGMDELGQLQISDPHSFAQPAQVQAVHLDLNVEVDFEQQKITGTATYAIDNKTGDSVVVFDTKNLEILGVSSLEDSAVVFSLGDKDPILGQALIINLKPETQSLTISYATTAGADALQWLSPQQTAGKKHPFLFTQSQAILARTWIPCQDGPGIRFTYNATVKVPTNLMAVMSATNPTEKATDGIYHFEMKQPIPAYLMALAVGDIQFKSVGERTGVYAEPSQLDEAVHEFADMEKMLVAAEELYGAYRWGRYDLIVLPPSFPFGGMENPRLTFATPTILAGDRSLTSLVAHELAHSWSGNLVTNATWNDFWLNEGFTVYFENRIMEKLYGKPYADMLAVLGYEDLLETIADLGETSDDTKLKLALDGRDPDDGMTDIAYEKGFSLLRTIEQAVGRERWDAFLKAYFDSNAFGTMTTEGFLAKIKKDLFQGDQAMLDSLKLEQWIYEPGLPASYVPPTSERFMAVDAELSKWKDDAAPANLVTEGWSTHEWLRFIRGLPKDISLAKMAELDKAFGFTKSGNAEILGIWFEYVIRQKYDDGYEALEKFLLHVGRRKFVKPLYKLMAETEDGKAMAKKIYAKARPNYHSVTQNTIDEILK